MKNKILFFLFLPIFFINCKEEKHLYKIGFSQAMSNDKWRESMNKSIYDAALFNKDIDLKFLDAKWFDTLKAIPGYMCGREDIENGNKS